MSNINKGGIYMIYEDSVLEELWNGNIFPRDSLLNTKNEEIDKISAHLDEMHFALTDKAEEKLFNKINTGRYNTRTSKSYRAIWCVCGYWLRHNITSIGRLHICFTHI